jgi:hypothetical protein
MILVNSRAKKQSKIPPTRVVSRILNKIKEDIVKVVALKVLSRLIFPLSFIMLVVTRLEIIKIE